MHSRKRVVYFTRKPVHVTDAPDAPYFERATTTGSCRLHAINALLGGPVLSWERMIYLTSASQHRRGITPSTDHSYFSLDGTTGVTDCLGTLGFRTFVNFGIGAASDLLNVAAGENVTRLLDQCGRYCLYTRHHIFSVIKYKSNWFVCDSSSACPRQGRPLPQKDQGIILELSLQAARNLKNTNAKHKYYAEAQAIAKRISEYHLRSLQTHIATKP